MEKKIINNALCSYFMLWIFMLLPTKNEYINNKFVKNHAKTATFIQFLMLINFVVFISLDFLSQISILNYTINIIIHNIILLILLSFLFLWIHRSSLWKDFLIKDFSKISKIDKIYSLEKNKINEQNIFINIFSLITFLWFISKKITKNISIENNLKLNLLVSTILAILNLFNLDNVLLLVLLAYIIFVAFYAILLISGTVINLKLDFFPTVGELYYKINGFFIYLKNNIQKKDFLSLNETSIKFYQDRKNYFEKIDNKLWNYKNKLNPIFYYIPFLNIIWIIDLKTKYKNHIINWVLLTLLSIWIYFIDIKLFVFIIFISLFWIWELENNSYRIYFIFDIYNFFSSKISKIFSIFSKNKKEITEVTIKI